MENYEILSLIGKGNFGSISKILRKSDNKILVWKEMDYGHMTEREKQNIVSEVNILRELRHPNIVRYYDRIIDKKHTKIYIIMEYCEQGDISQLIKRHKKAKEYIKEEIIWKIFVQLLLALYECHNHKEGKILHRDIKPSNVFLDSESNVKLGDFGLSRMLSNESIFAYSHVGTPYYMSPEQIEEMKYDDKSDIWSLGCFLYELTTFNPPFDATNQLALAMKIKEGKVNPINKIYSQDLSNLILCMLRVNPNQRPNCEELINCPPILLRAREMKLKEHYIRIKKMDENIKNKEKEITKKEKEFLEKEKLFEEKEKKLKLFEDELNQKKKELDEKEINLNKREEEIEKKEKEALENIKKSKNFQQVEKNFDLYSPTKEISGLNINIDVPDDFPFYNNENNNNLNYRKTAPNLKNNNYNNFAFNDFGMSNNNNNNNGIYHPQSSFNYFLNQNKIMNNQNYFLNNNNNNSNEINNNNFYPVNNNNQINEINNNQNLYQQKIRYEKVPQQNNNNINNNINNYLMESNSNINNYLYDYNNMSTNNFVIENAPITNYNDVNQNYQNQFMDSTTSIEFNNYLNKQNSNNNINDYLRSTNGTSINSVHNKNIEKKNSVDSSNNIKNIIKNSVTITHKIK